MMNENEITSNDELRQLVKDGHFFSFCVLFALNKGYKDTLKDKKEVKFNVGDYKVEFDHNQMCFVLIHKIYFARIITAYYQESVFIGNNEDEVINDLYTELEKELNLPV